MSSTPTQSTGDYRVRPSTPSFTERSSDTTPMSEEDPAPISKPTVFTGESRLCFRERIRRLRASASGPTTPPRTTTPAHEPAEVPGAPRKARAFGLRRLSRDEDRTDEDILLDSKAKRAPAIIDVGRHRGYDTPVRDRSSSPLRQSWGPEEFAEIDAKLRALGAGRADKLPADVLCEGLSKD
ncbi:hypothetical protein F4825DRAFT_470731 [Nemania diffusa]|nr:hypothetical protein F4825DRAFT_470731 [Nemania diffusa]